MDKVILHLERIRDLRSDEFSLDGEYSRENFPAFLFDTGIESIREEHRRCMERIDDLFSVPMRIE
jgi:hypothetical protein